MSNTPVLDQIVSQTNQTTLGPIQKARLQLSLTLGALLEGGNLTGGWGVGDQGNSYGPFQINLPYHPGVTAADATNPSFAVQYMLPGYQAALAQVPESLWQSNPEAAAEQVAYKAERPAQLYSTARGQGTVDSAYTRAKSYLSGKVSSVSSPAGSTSSSSTSTSSANGANAVFGIPFTPDVGGALSGVTGDALKAIGHPIMTFVINTGLVVFGLILCIVGLVLMANAAKDDTQTVLTPSGGDGAGGKSAGESSGAEDAALA